MASTAHAQDTVEKQYLAFRVGGGFSYNFHANDLTNSGQIIYCNTATSGTGTGLALDGMLEIPLTDRLGLGISAGFSDRVAEFPGTLSYPMRDTAGQEYELTSRIDLSGRLAYIELQPDLRFVAIGTYNQRWLGLIGGMRIALPTNTSYSQLELLQTPEDAYFVVNNRRTRDRTIGSGPLTARASLLFGATFGVESFLPVGEAVSIVPRIQYDHYFNSVLTDAKWNISGLRFALDLRVMMRPMPVPPPPPPPPPAQPPPPLPPVAIITPYLQVDATGFDGEIVTGNALRATTPIVPAVFFDSTSAEIPASYRRQLDASVIPTDGVQAHAWLLPRIVRTLERNPRGRVILHGAAADELADAKAVDLAMRRAEAVKRLFVDMGIEASRIETKATVLPRIPSNREFPGGRIENRRVDIEVRNAPLQEWVTSERYAELRGRTRLDVVARNTGEDVVRVRVNGRDTTIPVGQQTVDVPVEMPILPTQSVATIDIQARTGTSESIKDTSITLPPLPRRSRALTADDFEAVLRFDYNSADITDDVKGLLKQLVEQLPRGSQISIQGSADILGTDTRNRELSAQRAANTEAYVRSLAGDGFTIVSGTTMEKFSDDTPQGRFLNRSIRLRVYIPE
jgi:outer membrane protein OmpA-like peptidoglycan-associated protein